MTKATDPRALVERLREDVFYGEERMHKMHKHNPLHLEAAAALTALLAENESLRGLLRQAVDEWAADDLEWQIEVQEALKGADQ